MATAATNKEVQRVEKLKLKRGYGSMTELQVLTEERNNLLLKIKEIETSCEGIDNEDNAKRLQELNAAKAQFAAQEVNLQEQLNAVKAKIAAISTEMAALSVTVTEKFLAAIKKQRWYFFKNVPEILFDRETGLLWANLDYFPGCKYGSTDNVKNDVRKFKVGNITDWVIPKFDDFKMMIQDKTFPYQEGTNYRIKHKRYGCCDDIYGIDLDCLSSCGISQYNINTYGLCVIPCSNYLVKNTDFRNNLKLNNYAYTEKERLQFILNLFLQNDLLPIFNDQEVMQLYKKVYVEKPALMNELNELQLKIEDLQKVTLLSSEFDYTALLAKYDVKAINKSVIKYYQAVQQWTCELIDKLDAYEERKEAVIRDFNLIGLKLSKKYEKNSKLTDEENVLLAERQRYLSNKLSLGMHNIKSKILAVKKQADDLEQRIDEIDDGENSIHELALLEKEERASFEFLAENTGKIIKNALLKIEYFENNRQLVMNIVDIWEKWSEDYRVFKTTYFEDLKSACEEDSIEEKNWVKWYQDWQNIRFKIEQKVQPVLERSLKEPMPTITETEVSVPDLLIKALDEYKERVDKFFRDERMGIYQKLFFQTGGDLQEKFESESELYKCTTAFQNDLQNIIFNCAKAEDRIFILRWANSLLDIQIDEILDFVADKDLQKISRDILNEFAALKQKNFDTYLNDAKAYGEEKSRREKEYNSLIFKMRKDLMKQIKSLRKTMLNDRDGIGGE